MLIQTVEEYINKHELIKNGQVVVVGLSGGPDSVFLLHALKKIYNQSLTLIAAHINHEWRPDSHRDVELCKNLCAELQIPLHITTLQELKLTLKFNGSAEEYGRKARRHFFESLATNYKADSIALGHHAQDQQETFFIRLIRGSSLSGLCSMWPHKGLYIRPLLAISKQDIITYLTTHHIAYIQDYTNDDFSYLRNRIRHTLMPAFEQIDNRAGTNLTKTITNLQHDQELLEWVTHAYFTTLYNESLQALNIDQLLKLPPSLINRILIAWMVQHQVPFVPSNAFFQEIIRFLSVATNSQHALHTHWTIAKNNGLAQIIVKKS